MRRVPIRAKVGAALTVPLLALLVLSLLEVQRTANQVAHVRGETQLARSTSGPAGVITRLQDERNWAVLDLVGQTALYIAPVTGYEDTRKATDESLRALTAEVESAGGAVEATYRSALDALGELDALRSDIDGTTGPRSLDNMPVSTPIYDRYSEVIDALLDAGMRVPLQVRDTDMRLGTELADIASRQAVLEGEIARETVVTAAMTPKGIDTSTEIATISALLAAFERNNRQLQDATGRYSAIVERHYPTELAQRLEENVDAAVKKGSIDDLQGFLNQLQGFSEARYWGLRDAISDAVVQRADRLNDEAAARQRLFVSLAIGTFVVAATMTWLVSRSITQPLQSLTRQARDVADQRLPDAVREVLATPPGEDVQVPVVAPVRVDSSDEVADVASTLNTVQESALGLAVEQALLRRNIADSFINLGRRNQNLLSRQLDFITQLESQETDPDTLASLFRLDHLATRMRRNAESLLVLAGVAPPRTWAAPLPLVDVIRAALGEVEDFQRVHLDRVEPVKITGTVAADLGHLLAELVENALSFSPPDQIVEIRGWNRDPSYTLVIVDWGVGMTGDELVQANRRLAGVESYTVAPSKYLGHYVAGTLAARHGIRLRLEPVAPHGTAATVDLPPLAIATPAATAPPMGTTST